mmetsp:Transcript_23270/g.62907  ORF Transcript_23270/g.62907 Transcript_23270/m.62907 type:complete len:200 (+) Transcript_23270:222-821(+)
MAPKMGADQVSRFRARTVARESRRPKRMTMPQSRAKWTPSSTMFFRRDQRRLTPTAATCTTVCTSRSRMLSPWFMVVAKRSSAAKTTLSSSLRVKSRWPYLAHLSSTSLSTALSDRSCLRPCLTRISSTESSLSGTVCGSLGTRVMTSVGVEGLLSRKAVFSLRVSLAPIERWASTSVFSLPMATSMPLSSRRRQVTGP